MKKLFIFLLTYLLLSHSFGQEHVPEVKLYSFEEFKPMLDKQNDTLYIINFWATWCKPCVIELPYFEKVNEKYENKKVKVILVSLDFPDELESRLKPFLKKKGIKSEVLLLNESDPNTFINKVSTKWSGAIPATYIYKGKNIEFFEGSFTYEELESIIKQKLKENEE